MTSSAPRLPAAEERSQNPALLLPGWRFMQPRQYLASACGRVRILKNTTSTTLEAGLVYSVHVRLGGEWVMLRQCRQDLADAAKHAKAVLADLAPLPDADQPEGAPPA